MSILVLKQIFNIWFFIDCMNIVILITNLQSVPFCQSDTTRDITYHTSSENAIPYLIWHVNMIFSFLFSFVHMLFAILLHSLHITDSLFYRQSGFAGTKRLQGPNSTIHKQILNNFVGFNFTLLPIFVKNHSYWIASLHAIISVSMGRCEKRKNLPNKIAKFRRPKHDGFCAAFIAVDLNR